MSLLQPCSTHFPYTTLFRSAGHASEGHTLVVVLDKRGDSRAGRIYSRIPRVNPPCPGVNPFVKYDEDRKSTRLNSSHSSISYAVFCLKKKNAAYLCS